MISPAVGVAVLAVVGVLAGAAFLAELISVTTDLLAGELRRWRSNDPRE